MNERRGAIDEAMPDQPSAAPRGNSDRLALWLLAGFTLLYLWPTFLLASRRLLWHDELFTLHVARQPGLSAIWAFLKTGAEQTPPLFFLVTRTALGLLDETALALRLPEVLGFGIMSFCVFHLVARRTSVLYGAVAMLFPLTTGTYLFAFEARPHGLATGFAGLALLAWQRATEDPRRALALVGLATSLVAAVSTQYYAVLLLVPLGLGEVVRTLCRRRLDLAVWAAFGVPLLALLAFVPLYEGAQSYSAHFWAKPTLANIPAAYYYLLLPKPPWPRLVALLLVAVAWLLDRWRAAGNPSVRLPWPPLPEVVAVVGYAALPVLTYGLAVAFTGANSLRYSLSAIVGVAVIFGWVAHRLLSNGTWSGATLAVLLGATFVLGSIPREADHVREDRERLAATYTFLASHARDGLPIAVERTNEFLPLTHYAPPSLAGRFVYLADPGASLRYRKTDTTDRGLLTLRHWAPVNVQDYMAFLDTGQPFLVYMLAERPYKYWLFEALKADGVPLEFETKDGLHVLWLAQPGAKPQGGTFVQPGDGFPAPGWRGRATAPR